MLLSVIVPVYNIEKYLEKCVESLVRHQFKENDVEYEILLINDGSTDKSGDICDNLSEKYEIVNVYHKENGGLSDARNFGLGKSRGEFISFVDSDDFLEEYSYERLITVALKEEAEIVVGNPIKYYEDGRQEFISRKRGKEFIKDSGTNFLTESMQSGTMLMTAQLNIYRRKLIEDSGIYFKKGMLHEDELWTPQIFLKASKVCYIDFDFYYHLHREGSITQSKDKTKNAIDLLKICEILDKVYDEIKDSKTKSILKDYLCMLYLNAFYIGKLHKKEVNLNRFFPLRRARSFKNKLKATLFFINKKMYYKINSYSKEVL